MGEYLGGYLVDKSKLICFQRITHYSNVVEQLISTSLYFIHVSDILLDGQHTVYKSRI